MYFNSKEKEKYCNQKCSKCKLNKINVNNIQEQYVYSELFY